VIGDRIATLASIEHSTTEDWAVISADFGCLYHSLLTASLALSIRTFRAPPSFAKSTTGGPSIQKRAIIR